VIKEKKSVFLDLIVSVIVRKKLFEYVSNSEWLLVEFSNNYCEILTNLSFLCNKFLIETLNLN
jgi:hypothetical protein